MKKFASLFLSVMAIFFSCNDETSVAPPCTTSATIRKIPQEGCLYNVYYFELEDGTILQAPIAVDCIYGTEEEMAEQTRQLKESPLYQFEFLDGKKVKIGYEVCSTCLPGCIDVPVVDVTCLEEIDGEEK